MSATLQQRLRDYLAATGGQADIQDLCRQAFAAETSPALARRLLATALPDELQFDGDRVVWLAPSSDTDTLDQTLFRVVDIETTGMHPDHARIIEVGAVLVQGDKVLEETHFMVNPQQPIPAFIRGLTGISDDMVADAPPLPALIHAIHQLFTGTVPVAHNASFDFRFLDAAFRRHGLPEVGDRRLCTIKLARALAPGKRYTLDELAQRLLVEANNRHRALGDAQTTAGVLIELLRRADQRGIHSVTALRGLRAPRGRGTEKKETIGTERIRTLPAQPGVYRFRNKQGEVIYVGKAKNLRHRLGSYFVGSPAGKANRMLLDVADFDYTVVGSELEALLEEAREIRLRQPAYNRMLRRWDHYGYLWLDPEDPFPRLRYAREKKVPDRAEIYGPFRLTARGGKEVKALRETFHLRDCAGRIRLQAGGSPCVEHGLHRCSAPCVDVDAHETYARQVEGLRRFLKGDASCLKALRADIQAAAEEERFERASTLRDRYRILTTLHQAIRSEGRPLVEGDRMFVLPAAEEQLVRLYLLRRGQAILTRRIRRDLGDWCEPVTAMLSQPIPSETQDMEDARICEAWLRRKSALPTVRVSDHGSSETLAEALRSTGNELL